MASSIVNEKYGEDDDDNDDDDDDYDDDAFKHASIEYAINASQQTFL